MDFNLKIKKLNDLAKTPTKGSAEAAGFDLYAATDRDTWIEPHQTAKIGTGLAIEFPPGMFGGIFARSGTATKQGLRPANCVGVVDSDYRGEVIVALHNDNDMAQMIPAGSRIAQLIMIPFIYLNIEEVNELNETDRGEGGFGSTGIE